MTTSQLHTWWHELNTWEPEVACAFYQETLGWTFEKVPLPDGTDYWIARQGGRAVAGVFALERPLYEGVPSHWMTYRAVSDVTRVELQAEDARGEVMRRAIHVPGVGKLSVVCDPGGAMIGLIEPDPHHALAEAA